MFLSKIKILRSHRSQWIKDLDGAVVPSPYRGCPVITDGVSSGEEDNLVALCPTGAIGKQPLSIDLGRCIFCGECALHSPLHIRFGNNHRMAASRREDLVVTSKNNGEVSFDRSTVRAEIGSYFKNALKLREVSAGGDNACEMELNASMNVNFDFSRYGIEFHASPRHTDGVVITGPISANMAQALDICYDAVADPKIVILVGADAISGGLFAGSRALNRDFIDNHHVDLYVPGDPAHPLTFIDGVMKLTGRKFDR